MSGESPTAAGNADMVRAWDGDEGTQWSEHVEHHDRAVRGYHEQLLAALAIAPGEHVIDVGCGNGQTAVDAARAAAPGPVLGLDLSAAMLARARERAAAVGATNTTFEQADAQVYPFAPGAADVVLSRFGGMFFADPVAAFSNLARALKPGGRMALIAWQPPEGNEWISAILAALARGRPIAPPQPGAPGPFGLADPESTMNTLADSGLEAVAVEAVTAPFEFGRDADDAFEFGSSTGLGRGLLAGLDETEQAAAKADLRAAMVAHDTGAGVLFDSAGWLITARKPA
jgi:SAM-dependent methyltransferase